MQYKFLPAHKMEDVHSDIRGPIFIEANRLEAEGRRILKLNTGNPAAFGFGLPDSVRRALDGNIDKAVAYCDLKGMSESRQAIYDYHVAKGFSSTSVDDIFIGNGVSEVAWMAMTALLNPGDEVLIPKPSYSLWTNLAVMSGAKPVLYLCDEQSDWYPDIADIKAKITPRTRAMLIINPNNPTGAVYPDSIVREMVELAVENNIVIFSDEIYDRLVMDGLSHTSSATVEPAHPVVTFNGLSKSHIICGFRCGWMIISGHEEFRRGMTGAIQKIAAMRLCGNALAQLVIPAALSDFESTQAMLVPGGRIYEQREATCRALDGIEGISYVKNHAAFYIFPKIDVKRFNVRSDKQLAMDVLQATNILFIPGSGFDWPEPDHFRLVMLPKPEELCAAVKTIGEFLKTYTQGEITI